MNKKKLFFQIAFTLLLCIMVEGIAWLVLRQQHQQTAFLLNLHFGKEVAAVKEFGYNEIDPLCGWALSNAKLESMGYETEQNCIARRSKGERPSSTLTFLTSECTA